MLTEELFVLALAVEECEDPEEFVRLFFSRLDGDCPLADLRIEASSFPSSTFLNLMEVLYPGTYGRLDVEKEAASLAEGAKARTDSEPARKRERAICDHENLLLFERSDDLRTLLRRRSSMLDDIQLCCCCLVWCVIVFLFSTVLVLVGGKKCELEGLLLAYYWHPTAVKLKFFLKILHRKNKSCHEKRLFFLYSADVDFA